MSRPRNTAIIPPALMDDGRAGLEHFRVMGALGARAHDDGRGQGALAEICEELQLAPEAVGARSRGAS